MSVVAHKSDSDRLVQHHFFEPLGIKLKDSEEKIHLFYDVLNIAFLSGLPTDYKEYNPSSKGFEFIILLGS